jgi:hypothetical protein
VFRGTCSLCLQGGALASVCRADRHRVLRPFTLICNYSCCYCAELINVKLVSLKHMQMSLEADGLCAPAKHTHKLLLKPCSYTTGSLQERKTQVSNLMAVGILHFQRRQVRK